jgi:hypothetical protein
MLVVAVVAVFLGGVGLALVVPLLFTGPSPPRAASVDSVLRLAQSGPRPDGLSARAVYTNHLLPGLAGAEGAAPSPLLAGGSGRYWQSGGRARLELQSDDGDTQVLTGAGGLRLVDAAAGSESSLPFGLDSILGSAGGGLVPAGWAAEKAEPGVVGGRSAYLVTVRPDDQSSLLAGVRVAVDADSGVPLSAGVLARGRSVPVIGVDLHDVRVGDVPDGVFQVSSRGGRDVPAGAALGGLAIPAGAQRVAGSGLSSIYAWQQPAAGGSGLWESLPVVRIGSSAAHELVTPLGTVLRLERAGQVELFAGLVPASAVEEAAKRL